MITQTSPDGRSTAHFSDCMRYRYLLTRDFGLDIPTDAPRGGICHFVMLNPSTADAFKNDPTIAGCEKRARKWGYDGIAVTNLFALRSTDPKALYELMKYGGIPRYITDCLIRQQALASAITICGWGEHGKHLDRGRKVAEMLTTAGCRLHVLALNKGGSPKHPLYIGHAQDPIVWTTRLEAA